MRTPAKGDSGTPVEAGVPPAGGGTFPWDGGSDTPPSPVPAAVAVQGRFAGRDRRAAARRLVARSAFAAVAVAVTAIVTVPLLVTLVVSTNANELTFPYQLTSQWWRAAFANPSTFQSILVSFLLTVRVPLAVVIAFLVAWAVARKDLPAKGLIEYGLWFAFFMPTLPMALAWILLADPNFGILNERVPGFGADGLITLNIYSIPGIIWVHMVASTIPIMTVFLRPALQQIDRSTEEAASVAGASRLQVLTRVTLRLVAPAVVTAVIAGLIKGLEVFEIEQIIGVPAGIYVFSTRLYELVSWDPPRYGEGAALSIVFLILLLGLAVVYMRVLRRQAQVATITGKGGSYEPEPRTAGSYVISGLLLTYLLLGIGLPLAVVGVGSVNTLFGFFNIADPWTLEHWTTVLGAPAFSRAAGVSLVIAATVGVGGVFAYAVFAWYLARGQGAVHRLLGVVAWLPWALPGLLLGVAYLLIFLRAPVLRQAHGTLVPLVAVLIVQMMPLGVAMLSGAVTQLSTELEEAALMAGARKHQIFRRVTLPLLFPMMVSVFLFVVMGTLRDISSTVLLATPGTRTLPLLMFEYANSGSLEAASVVGIIIAGLALLLVALLRRIGRDIGITG